LKDEKKKANESAAGAMAKFFSKDEIAGADTKSVEKTENSENDSINRLLGVAENELKHKEASKV
jgi:hypothetical protein